MQVFDGPFSDFIAFVNCRRNLPRIPCIFSSCCVLVLHDVLVMMNYISSIDINKTLMKTHDENTNLHGHFLVNSAIMNCTLRRCSLHGETYFIDMLSMSCQPLSHDQDTYKLLNLLRQNSFRELLSNFISHVLFRQRRTLHR